MINITATHMVGEGHEHIGSLRWTNPQNASTGESTREALVVWIRDQNGSAFVSDARGRVAVGVVNASPPYLRTHADGRWTDNLLALPRF